MLGSGASIQAAMRSSARKMVREFNKAVSDIRARLTIGEVMEAMKVGPEAVSDLMASRVALSGVLEAKRDAFKNGGEQLAGAVPKSAERPTGGRLVFGFDLTDPKAEEWLSSASSELVQNISDHQRDAIQVALEAGMREGRNPIDTARNIAGRISPVTGRREGGLIMLTGNQAQWVENARAQLSSADPEALRAYLTRQRRDKRFDHHVRRAIAEGRPVPFRVRERMLARYSDRLLAYRAETIARNESLDAFATGRHQALEQLKNQAGLSPEDIVRKWDATGDAATRPDHAAMDGQERGPDDPFSTSGGALLMYPGDRSLGAPPEQTINCRCMEIVEVDFVGAAARARGG